MLTRRDLMGKVAAGATVILAGGVAKASYRAVDRDLTAVSSQLPADMPQGIDPAISSARPSVSQPAAEVVAKVESVSKEAGVTHPVVATAAVPAPWDLIRPLELGSSVGYGWHVAGLTGAVDGSAVLTLQSKQGRTHRVHICRNDGSPQGLIYTRRFDLVVMNGGRGDLPTEEKFARVVAQVARVLAANETDPRQGAIVAALLPQSERLRLFNDARLR